MKVNKKCSLVKTSQECKVKMIQYELLYGLPKIHKKTVISKLFHRNQRIHDPISKYSHFVEKYLHNTNNYQNYLADPKNPSNHNFTQKTIKKKNNFFVRFIRDFILNKILSSIFIFYIIICQGTIANFAFLIMTFAKNIST